MPTRAQNFEKLLTPAFSASDLPTLWEGTQVWPVIIFTVFIFSTMLMQRFYPNVDIKAPAATPTRAQAVLMKWGTWAIDYTIVAAFLWFFHMQLAGDKLNPFHCAALYPLIPLSGPLRDDIMCRWGPWSGFTSRGKLAFRHTFVSHLETLKVLLFIMTLIFVLAFAGCFEFPAVHGVKDVLYIWVEFIAMITIKDLTSMHYLHEWMHKSAYYLHKHHHLAKADCQTWHAFQFGLPDLIFESSIGPFLVLAAKLLLGFNPSVNLFAFLLSIIADMNTHSMNPYTVYFFNPVLDHLAKPCMCHNLHHAYNQNYMELIPINHFFSPDTRQYDMDKYNKIMRTSFLLV